MNWPQRHVSPLKSISDIWRRALSPGLPNCTFPILFAFFALLSVFSSAFIVPPFQVPDKDAHFTRAAEIGEGHFIGYRQGGLSGDLLPSDLEPILHVTENLKGHPDRRPDAEHLSLAEKTKWTGTPLLFGFPNTVIYGPVCYLPQAAAIAMARLNDRPILTSLRLGRLAAGLSFVIISTMALCLCQKGRFFLLVLLSLPMTLWLAGSVSQDGNLIALCALLSAILSRYASSDRSSLLLQVLTGCGFGVIAMAKPPLLPLAFLPSLLATSRPTVLRTLLCPAIACCLAGTWFVLGLLPTELPKTTIQIAQAQRVRSDPFIFMKALWRSLIVLHHGWLDQFIGMAGWLDTALPRSFLRLSRFVLVLSFLSGFSIRRHIRPTYAMLLRNAAIISIIGTSVLGIFLSLFLIWTPPDSPLIDGIQGRYFLPVACFLCLLFPNKPQAGARPVTLLLALAWLSLSVATAQITLIERFIG
ncbi:MAG: DUF2142 domain-containing protein [Acetobacter sp.]|nr:DUF2142 domain-containing protein [Acetobacter sp.]MCH4059967.1 DUF2142 domain-containing protein [Acetobacter sp.]MCH4086908.1 DUF2142 domain-containing protein [Acetobacter sp.]MCI1294950.1 DUF2142 domain-containing protein [Acetobacter sp.]MCI1320922.1 DUF2142 domain-containing protein [Acetobacter sp.]